MRTDHVEQDILFWDLNQVQAAHHRVRVSTYWARHAAELRDRTVRLNRRNHRTSVMLCILAGAAILLSLTGSVLEVAAVWAGVTCGTP